MDQLRSDKSSLERKLHDAEIELKSIDDSHRQSQSSLTRQTSTNRTDDENSNLDDNKTTFRNDDDEGLSDNDSDVIEMKQTLNELKHISALPTSSITEQKPRKMTTVELSKTNNINPFRRTISFERPSNPSFIDSGQWSNTLLSTMNNTNNTYPLSHYQSSISKTNFWQSQPSLITREAVLKAARDVLPPGVIDHLKSKH
jgi:hypothetical protein